MKSKSLEPHLYPPNPIYHFLLLFLILVVVPSLTQNMCIAQFFLFKHLRHYLFTSALTMKIFIYFIMFILLLSVIFVSVHSMCKYFVILFTLNIDNIHALCYSYFFFIFHILPIGRFYKLEIN